MKHRELGAEDPLISYDKKEKNPQSESRRSGLIYYNAAAGLQHRKPAVKNEKTN